MPAARTPLPAYTAADALRPFVPARIAGRRPPPTMITVRIGVALSLLVSIAALAVAVAALMGDIRSNSDDSGRVVQTGITNRLSGDPVEFLLDDFFMSPDGEGRVNALYAYPPGFSGSIRGCKVVWQRDAKVVADGRVVGPGLFTDPCTGAHFDSAGNLVDGPADRGLDRFAMTPEPDGLMVDTRTLLCGPSVATATSTEATATPTPVTCKRVARSAAR